MGLVNEISASRIPRQLTRFFRILGVNSPVPQLAPEISPSFDISSMPPEMRLLGGEKRYSFGSSVAAGGAGKTEYAQLGSPTGSNLLIVIERIVVASTSNIRFAVGLSSFSSRAGILFSSDLDSRQNPGLTQASTSGAFMTTNSDATADGVAMDSGAFQILVPANNSAIIDVPIILTPGNACSIADLTQNLAITGTFVWRERALEDSEVIA